jgi:ubiquinone/menaquinone biosynthesis C-methylase UbiE
MPVMSAMHAIHKARATMFGLAHHADHYERVAGRLASRMYHRVTDDVVAANLPSESRVLDVGTGPGLLPLRLAQACPQLRIDAVDLSADMIERARVGTATANASTGELLAVDFAVGDVAELPYPTDSFDLVVSSISQHHWADPAAGLREIARVLRPGASAWIYDFRWALGRAERALGEVNGGFAVTKQSPLLGGSWFSPIGRLVLRLES